MNKFLERPIIVIALLAILCSYLFFFRLGGMALTDPDETFYAQTAKEMLNRNEWMTPYLYGKPQFEKPIFFYWLIEASYRIFGVNEFAARFPSAVCALLGIIGVYLLGTLFFNNRAGFLAAVMLATCVECIILSRACVTDMALTMLMVYVVLFFFYGYLKEKKYFYILSSISLALATLTKGPIAIMLSAAAIFIFLIIAGDLKALKRMPIFWAALAFIAVAAPWYILAYKLHGKGFVDVFFGFHNITRFLESEHKIGSQVYYNIPIVLGGFFPWSVFLPFGFWHMFKNSRTRELENSRTKIGSIFVLTWFFVIFAFFSISSTKLPTYIFPSFISLALTAGVLWDDFLKSKDASKSVVRGVKISYYLLVAGFFLGAIGAPAYIKFDYPVILKGSVISSLFLVSGILISSVFFLKKRFIAALLSIVCAVAIFLLPISMLVLPQIERYETSKEISQKLLGFMKGVEGFGSESNYLPGLAFYTGKFPVDLDKHHVQVAFLSSPQRVWAVLKEKNHRHLYELDTKPFLMRPTYMVYKIGKRAIVTNIIPEDGAYLVKRERIR